MKKRRREDEWPEFLEEREPATEADAIDESLRGQGIKVRERLNATLDADMEPGERLHLHWQELEVEAREGGVVSILVEGVPVWSGRARDIKDIRTYSSSIDKTLCGVCVNGKLVWVRG